MSDAKNLNKQRYSEFADSYVTSITHAKGTDLDLLLEFANPKPSWKVLDIATGGGHTALKFAPHVASVVATDLTPTMLQSAEKFIGGQGVSNVQFKVADAENLPFDDAQFDLVTCRIAPHHFPDVSQFVREATRVLKSDGLLLVQDHVLSADEEVAIFADSFEKVRDPSHNQAYSAQAWITFFEDAGLHVEKTHELTKRHQFISWAKRQGNDDETIKQLSQSLAEASATIKAWMQPEAWTHDKASFVNHHIILMGRKSDSKN